MFCFLVISAMLGAVTSLHCATYQYVRDLLPQAVTTRSVTLSRSLQMRMHGRAWLREAPAATSCCTLSKVQRADLAEPVMG